MREALALGPALVLIEGEAGVGKSRLIREFLAIDEVQARRPMWGSAQPLEDPFPLGPVIEALRSTETLRFRGDLSDVCGVLAAILPELKGHLPPPPEPLGDASAERHRVFRALRELLDNLHSPVLVLEDLHWSDSSTVEFLRFLTSDWPNRLVLVTSYRSLSGAAIRLPGLIHSSGHRSPLGVQISLKPLTTEGVGQLISRIVESPSISEEFANHITSQTGGLPYAVEEVVRLLIDRGHMVKHEDGWVRIPLEEMGVPEGVRAAVLERAQGLSDEARTVLQIAALFVEPESEALVASVSELDSDVLVRACSEALASGLLIENEGGGLEFRHALARQAIYESLPGPILRKLHLNFALALEPHAERRRLAELAHHFKHAGASAKWSFYGELAADHAESLYDPEGAALHLHDALSAPDIVSESMMRMALKLGRIARSCLDRSRSIEILTRVLDDTDPSDPGRAELRLRRAQLLVYQEGEKESHYRELADTVDDLMSMPDLAASAMRTLATPWRVPADSGEHKKWLERMAELLPLLEEQSLRSNLQWDHAVISLYLGDPRGWKLVEQILEVPGTRNDFRTRARGLSNVATASFHLGHYERARSFLAEASREGVAHGLWMGSVLKANELQIDWARGAWEELGPGGTRFESAIEAMSSGCVGRGLVVGLSELVHGERAKAEEHLSLTVERARSAGAIPMLVTAHAGLARSALATGDVEGAHLQASQGWDLIATKNAWSWAGPIAPTAISTFIAIGETEQAARSVRRMRAGLRGKDAPGAEAALETCEGLVEASAGRREKAVAKLERAMVMWSRLPNPYEVALVQERRGLLGIDDAEISTGFLLDALKRFGALEATWDIDRVRLQLRSRGVPLPYPWRGGRRGYGEALSPREREIATMAAAGKTNKEIATEMFISPRTVEFHLAKAMKKIGVANRKGLVGGSWAGKD